MTNETFIFDTFKLIIIKFVNNSKYWVMYFLYILHKTINIPKVDAKSYV